ncbi:MAG: purine-nucleoside phosphorylase, partial [Kiritimatiellae bacterium]|nr:purine-nucleoside phosphorylase [Kiritimatiellia bacterium]
MEMEYFDKAADFLPDECFRLPPDISVILGSGWGDALKKDRVLCRIAYADIPGMGAPIVAGHSGEFILYEYAGKRIAAFSGRRHW